MSKLVTVVFGFVFGTLVSFLTAFVFMLIGQVLAGGITSFQGESWLYISSIIPFAITFAVIGGYIHNKKAITKRKLWFISFVSAFFVSLVSGTVGAIFAEFIDRGGLETLNVDGTLIWGTVYSFALLPITVPFARFLIGMFSKLSMKFI
ncbi:hypothetical protein EJF36_12130 [Bacillus sp. HMF5848]|uniref:hypothetical protein n=1 Tax=Bacillus sp. HMF5848 TaxID=2495421 RepID=UPI000F790C99|nr:hypothetical protein [Bacillus sp. HMF5848]RSK27566.1 hypothetical protein EJF36_12130 [Bacillus sp. HMF5848]